MRALTFKGYLLSQLQELSGVGGTSLYSFSKLAENNFRLKDALCLYLMMFTDKNLKNKLLKKYDYLNDGCEKLSGITDNNVKKYVSEKELSEYKTIYDNYLYRLEIPLRPYESVVFEFPKTRKKKATPKKKTK